MSIFSRRKRLLNRTSARVNSGRAASGRAQFHKIFRRNRTATAGMPKMSSRRQFHRALRRHPAWPMVMEQAAARAKLHKEQEAARARLQKEEAAVRAQARKVHSPAKFRRTVRRNRALLVTLLVVGGLVALLTGISMAQGEWYLQPPVNQPSQPPPGRFGAATTFDEANDEMLIFGGFLGSTPKDPSGNPVGYIVGLADPRNAISPSLTDGKTWAYKAATGRWFDRSQSAIHAPSPRGFASMAYDGARKIVVLFGGAPYRSNAVSGETWTWDGQDWTLQNPPEPRPDPRQNAVMVYDAHRKVVVMFGGRGADGKPLNDTWTWDGSAWKIMPSGGAPSPRHSAAMAYDVCRAEAVMFGGIGDAVNNFFPQPGETWIWDGAKWRTPTKTPLLSPPRRVGASMAYSGISGRVMLFGGLYTPDTGRLTVAVDSEVWRWDEASATGWERMNSDATTLAYAPCGALIACDFNGQGNIPPPARAYASFTPLGAPRFSLFGGTPGEGLRTGLAIDGVLSAVPEVAFFDHFLFSENRFLNTDNTATPLNRRCSNPVPLPPDAAPIAGGSEGPEPAKVPTSDEVREIKQLPVLVGTDWPQGNRDTHFYLKIPNPNYTPAPDCPNRLNTNGNPNGEDGSNTHLITDPKRNRVYQFFICDPDRGSGYNQQDNSYQSLPKVGRLKIQAYDGTTLKPLGSVITPVDVTLRGYQAFLGDMLLHDADRGLFYVRPSYYSDSTNSELVVIRQDLIEKSDPTVKKIPHPTGSIAKMSFFNHPKTGRPKLLINRGGTSLSQVDIESNTSDWNATWDGAATGCASMGADIYSLNMTPMRSGNRVYNACAGSGRGGIVRVTITENADGSETAGPAEVFLGPVGVSGNWGDPQTERMLLLSQTSGGVTLWAFDGKASRYVGRAGIHGAPKSYVADTLTRSGFDRETGRLYVHMQDDQSSGYKIQGGLLMVDARLTPMPQFLKFSQFASLPAAPVAVLPSEPGLPRRVFIRRQGGPMKKYPDGETIKMPNEMFYTVLADEVPIPGQAEIGQLDALTIAVPESPGKTEVSFDAEGSGYGIRLRSVGGIWSALRAPQQAYNSFSLEALDNVAFSTGRPFVPSCLLPDRELMMGWVPQAHLSDLDAAARSSGLDVDSNSKTDLQGPFSRCTPPATPGDFPPTGKPVFDALWPLQQMAQFEGNKAVGPNLKWDKHFHEVECVGNDSNVTQTTGADISGSASCNQKEDPKDDWVKGTARGALGPAAANTAFSVGEGTSSVTVARESERGVVATSTAVATGIKLPDLTIGLVKTEAVVWSNGRPGEGRAKFTRTICNVKSNPPIPVNPPDVTKDDRAPSTGCLTENQQKELVKQWNDRWGINSKMFLPTPDPEFYKGSPGGYIAGVIKPVADEIDDQLFAKDFQKEVPGLVIVFYKDSLGQGPAQQSLQLAAVRAVAGLGVQCGFDLIYSPSSKNCVALTFEDDPVEFEEEEDFSSDDTAFNSYDSGDSDGGWTPVATGPPEGLALGKRIGRFIQTLPIIRQLPLRQIGEALLAGAVWYLLGLPLFFASRRFALNLARRS